MHAPLPESQRGYPAARASRRRRLAAGGAVGFLVAGSAALFVLGTDDGPAAPARVQQPYVEPAAPAAVPAPVVEFDIDTYGHRIPRRPTASPTSPLVRKSGPVPAPVPRKQTATVTRPRTR